MSAPETRTLEPSLTEEDLKVLAAVAPCGQDDNPRRGRADDTTIWQIGETLDTLDLHHIYMTLNGLKHLGYVRVWTFGPRARWWRTPKGDQAIAASDTTGENNADQDTDRHKDQR